MTISNLIGIILAISLGYSHARPAEKDTRPSLGTTSTAPRFTTTSPVLVDPEALNVSATKPMLDGELLTSPELFEGDILETDSYGVNYGIPNWSDNTIPYVLSETFRPRDKQTIRDALQDFTAKTMVEFRERKTSDEDYVYIAPGFGCSSYVGRKGGRQLLVLQVPGCLNRGHIHHELMHVLGFFHEQSRTDRDEHVEINWHNIPKDQHSNFRSYSVRNSLNERHPYDIASLMHYGMVDFAIDKRVWTIRPKVEENNVPKAAQMGQRHSLSAGDVEKVKSAYPKGFTHPEAACPEGSGWVKHENSCYFFSFLTDTQPRKFSSAVSFCRKKDAKISSQPSETVGQFFAAQMHLLDRSARIYVASCETISPINAKDTQDDDCTSELHFICAKRLPYYDRLSVIVNVL